jgi:hypothetical protein
MKCRDLNLKDLADATEIGYDFSVALQEKIDLALIIKNRKLPAIWRIESQVAIQDHNFHS